MCQNQSVSNPPAAAFDELRRVALTATRQWQSSKATMALRATGLDSPEGKRASLDAIAADLGVSRETVRRARNDLLNAMEPSAPQTSRGIYAALSLPEPSGALAQSLTTGRALRRLLTMTGPLEWDEVLNAWARAGGKPPYLPLPADVAAVRAWANTVGGVAVSPVEGVGLPSVRAVLPEPLDQVSQFLVDALLDHPGGVDRHVLLELAEQAGLKPTTIATALSTHPAVTRIRRGIWALRGHRPNADTGPARVTEPSRRQRVRPTSFTWSSDGSLVIEFSVPRGPSPVVAVPRAVSDIIEGREFMVETSGRSLRIAVGKAKLWGFGPLLSELGLRGGARVTIALNLLAGTGTIAPVEGKGASR